MPIYEYRCEACNEHVEKLQKISDAPLTECPSCQQPTLKRLVSAAGFRLKGSGWYETDFKSGNKRNLADSEKESSDKKDTKKDTKTTANKVSQKKTGNETAVNAQ